MKAFERATPTEFDDIPVRLPSGSKAIVRLPRPFTKDDASHLIAFLTPYIEEVRPNDPSHPDMMEDVA